MKKTISVFVLCLVLSAGFSNDTQAFAQSLSSCRENTTAPAIAPYRWTPAAQAHVAFARGQFKKSELEVLAKVLDSWQVELAAPGINIQLINDGEQSSATDQSHSLFISRKDELPAARQGQFTALAGAHGYFTAGEIAIKSSIGKAHQLSRVLSHELGHAFGLRDCPSCRHGATIMNLRTVVVNGISIGKLFGQEKFDLTVCDREIVKSGYQMETAAGIDIPVGSVIGEDEVEDVVSKTNFDTAAPEVGEGKALIESANFNSPEPGATEKLLLDSLFAVENLNSQLLNNYAFKRDVLIETIGLDGEVTGSYHRLSQFVFDDAGKRVEKLISFPKPNLKRLIITDEDVQDLAGVQLLGWETRKSDLYRIVPEGRDAGTNQLLFRVVPRDLLNAKATGERVFYGTLWVDESTMKIVKVKGRALPEGNQRFPLFETERGQVAQGIWGPASTFADEVLIFPHQKIRMRIKVRYFDYREFRSNVTITALDVEPGG